MGGEAFESVLPGPVIPAELAPVVAELLRHQQPPGLRVRDLAQREGVRWEGRGRGRVCGTCTGKAEAADQPRRPRLTCARAVRACVAAPSCARACVCRGKAEALELAKLLWDEGIVCTVPAAAQAVKAGHHGILGKQHHKGGKQGSGKRKQRGGAGSKSSKKLKQGGKQ